MFYQRYAIDTHYGGLALEAEGERCSRLLSDPKIKILIMSNHGLLVLGDNVADTFNRLYYFERAAMTYIHALQTGKKLRVLSHEIAEKTARELDEYGGQAERHFDDLKTLLDRDGSDYRK